MKSRLEKAIEYIHGYCNKHYKCENCKLITHKTEYCQLANKMPCDWNVNIKESDGEMKSRQN